MTPFDLETLRAQEPQLRRLARAIVGDAYADDVVQDAWTAALTHSGDAPESWGAWLNRVTRNLAWKRRKRDGNERDRALAAFGGEHHVPPADDVVARVEEKHVLERAILDLDEPYRSVLLWRYYEDLTVEEVSRRAGTVPSTTRTHLQRGLERLRARLESEKGPEWRMALIPFLRPKAAAVKTAAAAGASGVATMTVFKLLFACILVAALGAFSLERFQIGGGGGFTLADLEVSRPEAPEPPREAPVRMADPEPPGASVRSEKTAIAAPVAPAEPAAAEDKTALQLVDYVSGRPFPGVTFKVRYQVKKRKFFFTRTEQATIELTTDAEGRATLPAAADREGLVLGSPIFGSVTPVPAGDTASYTREQYLKILEVLDDGTVQLSAEPCDAFWVRLPEGLGPEEIAAVDAKLMVRSFGSLSALSSPIAPLAARGRDLLFLTPSYIDDQRWKDHEVATMHIATTDEGPSFHAKVRRGQNLGDEPSLAIRCNEMVQRLTLVDERTGAPVGGAHVSINQSSNWHRGHGDAYGSSVTNGEGRARFIGIPHGALHLHVTCEGYERLAVQREFTGFEDVTLKVRKKSDLRPVTVTLVSKKGSAPFAIDLAAYDNVEQGAFERLSSIDCRRKGAGWTGSLVLQHVPARPVFLDLSFYTRSYDRIGPITIEPNQDKITIDVGEEMTVLGLRLRVPDGVEVEYQQRVGTGQQYSYGGPHSDGAWITSVPDDGRPIHWIVQAPGYIPVVGTRDDFFEGTHEGRRFYGVAPQMVEGNGCLLSAEWRAVPDGVPAHFATKKPIEGVRFTRTDTGELLGVTDASGYVVLASAEPLGKVTATYRGKSQTHAHVQGFPGLGFYFKP